MNHWIKGGPVNRPFARIFRLFAWCLFLHVWNIWRQDPLAWFSNLAGMSSFFFRMFFLETKQAVDNAISAYLDSLYHRSDSGKVSVPLFCFPRLNHLHPYPETV
jgi:hypothetical protein